jgi:hypothetical protein
MIRRVAASCSFDGNQFILHVVQLNKFGMDWFIFEVKRSSLKDVGTQLFPGFGLGEDGMAKRPSIVAPLLRIANFEN